MTEITAAPVPRLRGMLHAGAFPAVLVAGFALVALAPGQSARIAAAVYGLTSATLFGVSAAYHRLRPATKLKGVLRRLDQAGILLLIAGSYTPFGLLALRGATRIVVLAVVWAGVITGIALRFTSLRAPRWLYTSGYIALGWVAVFILPQLLAGAGVVVLLLVAGGGLLYSLGGLAYALRRPDPWPAWFGFHEVFHALTIAAYIAQYAAVSLVVYRAA
jgi:hemolysin III